VAVGRHQLRGPLKARRAVLAGHRLRIQDAAADQVPQWRTVDPIGMVTVRDRGYSLASRYGVDRTYRLPKWLPIRRPQCNCGVTTCATHYGWDGVGACRGQVPAQGPV